MLLTIFTPTYNRADLLQNLYNSLKTQTNLDFEWLIVDDGSRDNTKEIVNSFIEEKIININYQKQDNLGKHIAINTGVNLAKGKYFFIVDSDDLLVNKATEIIFNYIPKIDCKDDFCGLVFNRISPDKKTIGGENHIDNLEASLYDLKFKYHLLSDKAEIFKTDILKQFPFPYFENEKFCPEALVVYRMSGNFKILYINKGIYICEYLEGGLTSSITKIRMKSAKATTMYYEEHFRRATNLPEKLKCSINFYRFQMNDKSIKGVIPFPYTIFRPLGILMHLNDKKITK